MPGYKIPQNILGVNNIKTVKGRKLNVETYILYLSPHKLNSKGKNICPKATEGCISSCLFTAGRGIYKKTQNARQNKTEYFLRDQKLFMSQLAAEIGRIYYNKPMGIKIAVRLNGTSDIPFENISVNGYPNIMSMFPDVQFYDYTKVFSRLKKELPENYLLVFSRAETESNIKETIKALKLGFSVSAVFDLSKNRELPNEYMGFKVVNGDEHDYLPKHIKDNTEPVIIGLKAKGKARRDNTGFVIKDF